MDTRGNNKITLEPRKVLTTETINAKPNKITSKSSIVAKAINIALIYFI